MNDPEQITYFAETDFRGKSQKFGIKAKDRSKHMYVIGKTGMGKSTMLENMAVQDLKNGNGVVFIDPHGGSAELLLDYVPEERIKDVLYFAPFDMDYPISFNVMEDVGPDKRHLVVNGLMATFEKIWADAWSARMAYILQNTLLALLEYPGATLLGVNRMLTDKKYRDQVVANVKDPGVRSFWVDEFAKYTDRYAQEATPAIQNKVGQFTSNPLIRNIVGQSKSTFDLRQLMAEKKIIIVNLSKGKVGEGNANLLGGMFITKIYLAAMSRADMPAEVLKRLPDFYMYVDEFQSFANRSFADILSEARKYKLSLTIAHQYIEQMEEEVRDAVFGNVGTTVAFRVGPFDAEVLEKLFTPRFLIEDIVNLSSRQIYLTLMIDGVGSAPFSAKTLPPVPLPERSFKDEIIANSRAAFAHPRGEVEKEIIEWHQVPGISVAPRGAYDSGPVEVVLTKSQKKRRRKKRNMEGGGGFSGGGGPGANSGSPSMPSSQSHNQQPQHHEPQQHRESPRSTPFVGLKDLIASAMEEKPAVSVAQQKPHVEGVPKPVTPPALPPVKEKVSEPSPVQERKPEVKKPNEIPESDLRNMLKVDENK